MTDAEPTSALLVGLPFTGKTTYLALLYLAIIQNKAGPIKLGGYRDDREFVNEIAGRLHRCQEAEHTEIEEQRAFALSLDVDGQPIYLCIPDLSGETWKHALEDRQWTIQLDSRVSEAVGYIIFLHASDFVSGASIAAVQAAAEVLDMPPGEPVTACDLDAAVAPAQSPVNESIEGDQKDTELAGPDTPPRSSRRQPTQVSLVDFLQLLCEERQERPARVSLVVSAWDLTGNSMPPEEWLRLNCRLVDQYLSANASWLEARIWGVSAQGGSFEIDTEVERLIEEDPVDRADVYRSDGSAGSCDEPLLWVLRGQSE